MSSMPISAMALRWMNAMARSKALGPWDLSGSRESRVDEKHSSNAAATVRAQAAMINGCRAVSPEAKVAVT
jgi:hypothetical protein